MTLSAAESPANVILTKFAAKGYPASWVACQLGLSASTVTRWRRFDDTGTHGIIPARYHSGILDLAERVNVRIKPADLIFRRFRRGQK